jgi:hypothetical protein
MSVSLLLTFLTEEQIYDVNKRSRSDERTYSITTSFDDLTKPQKAVLNQYVRDLKYPKPTTGRLGSKTEVYNTEEEMLSKGPEYSFDDLSVKERAFYDKYEKEKNNG